MKKLLTACAAAALFAVPGIAQAQLVTTVTQDGANVVATTTGSISTFGLTDNGQYGLDVAIAGQFGYVSGGTQDDPVEAFSGFTGPANFGNGGIVFADSGSGDDFAFNGSNFGDPYLFLPTSYVSGGALSSSSTFDNTTLAGLGLTTGVYTFTGAGGQTFTVNIGGAVPEPATWAMMLLGFGMVGFGLRYSRKQSVRVTFA